MQITHHDMITIQARSRNKWVFQIIVDSLWTTNWTLGNEAGDGEEARAERWRERRKTREKDRDRETGTESEKRIRGKIYFITVNF